MSSHKCHYCERAWPARDDYKECPVCREPTVLRPIEESMLAGVAEVEAIRGNFGWWLWEHSRA